MAEVEKTHLATPASTPAPAAQAPSPTPASPPPAQKAAAPAPQATPGKKAKVVSEGEGKVGQISDASYANNPKKKSLDEWVAKAEKYRKKAAGATESKPLVVAGEATEGTETPAAEEKDDGRHDPTETAESADSTDTPEVEGEETPSADGWKKKEKYTFNALGKEYELPKWASESINSKEAEEGLIELHTKSMGFDHVKMRHQELYDKHQTVVQDHGELVGGVTDLKATFADAVHSGKVLLLDDFFGKLQIPENIILNYAVAKAEFNQLPLEQQMMIQQQLQEHRQARNLRQQNSSLTQNAQRSLVQARTMQLQSVLARPDISNLVQSYDSQPGRKPGDFQERVRQYGEYQYMKSNQDVDAETAVKAVIAEYGLKPGPTQGQGTPLPAAAPKAPAAPAPNTPAPHRKVPTIPAIAGKTGMSPAKATIKSVADIKKYYKENYTR